MSLRRAGEADRALIENLFNLYRNDISAYCDDFRFVDKDGYFDPGIAGEILPFGDGVETYIIVDRGRNVGLITVTDKQYALEGCDWRFQELYLIRPARGRGLARAAAGQLLKEKGGRWCLSVYKQNLPARRFWDAFIRENGTLLLTMPGEEGMTDIVFDSKQEKQ